VNLCASPARTVDGASITVRVMAEIEALGLDLFEDPPAYADNTNHRNRVTVGHLDGR
jgi:hypothetical protein